MTLRLTLIRHCKSSWDGVEPDHERPLNPRGQRAADALGVWLADRMPTQVLCSDAQRTTETWQRIAATGGGPPETPVPALYHADPRTILRVLRQATADDVALVGHNPGIGAFAAQIVEDRPDHSRFRDYPTGATTVATFDRDAWAEVCWGDGRVDAFVVPRDL